MSCILVFYKPMLYMISVGAKSLGKISVAPSARHDVQSRARLRRDVILLYGIHLDRTPMCRTALLDLGESSRSGGRNTFISTRGLSGDLATRAAIGQGKHRAKQGVDLALFSVFAIEWSRASQSTGLSLRNGSGCLATLE